eukprot:CAMPEP_0183605812 /NCGR_PEP_ID=MMETSP0371-20130417/182641_1 /TAXON_ID=268820 /ORGANISM="Peridinium aciculiferum, Strain PAER-2" /LENGTH=47 /DNA_ID= /DNA_START= /DNA_END= /DNA_ORIENTATION=
MAELAFEELELLLYIGCLVGVLSHPSPPANSKHIVDGNIDIKFTVKL